MSGILEALINGVIVSTLVTAAVWLTMRAASGRLNAATKYLVWWTVLAITVFLPLWYLPEGLVPRIPADPPHQVVPHQVVRMPSVPQEIQAAERRAPQMVAANSMVPVRRAIDAEDQMAEADNEDEDEDDEDECDVREAKRKKSKCSNKAEDDGAEEDEDCPACGEPIRPR